MRLGIDYGTTRTVVAAVDRGNYPVVSFQTVEGDAQEWYPSLIAACGEERCFGLDAAGRQDDPAWALLWSFKRQLATLGPTAPLALGSGAVTAFELLTAYLTQLRRDLVERSNLRVTPHEVLEAVIAVPANANSNQRFLRNDPVTPPFLLPLCPSSGPLFASALWHADLGCALAVIATPRDDVTQTGVKEEDTVGLRGRHA